MSDELVSVSPAEPESEIGRFPIAGDAAVHDAVTRAREAFPAWRDAGFDTRAALLRRFRDLVASRRDGLAVTGLAHPRLWRTVAVPVWGLLVNDPAKCHRPAGNEIKLPLELSTGFRQPDDDRSPRHRRRLRQPAPKPKAQGERCYRPKDDRGA